MSKILATALLAIATMSTSARASDMQPSLLALAMPTRYHDEYIPAARDSDERLAKLHAFDLVWTPHLQVNDPQYLSHLWGGIYWSATGLGQQNERR